MWKRSSGKTCEFLCMDFAPPVLVIQRSFWLGFQFLTVFKDIRQVIIRFMRLYFNSTGNTNF